MIQMLWRRRLNKFWINYQIQSRCSNLLPRQKVKELVSLSLCNLRLRLILHHLRQSSENRPMSLRRILRKVRFDFQTRKSLCRTIQIWFWRMIKKVQRRNVNPNLKTTTLYLKMNAYPQSTTEPQQKTSQTCNVKTQTASKTSSTNLKTTT